MTLRNQKLQRTSIDSFVQKSHGKTVPIFFRFSNFLYERDRSVIDSVLERSLPCLVAAHLSEVCGYRGTDKVVIEGFFPTDLLEEESSILSCSDIDYSDGEDEEMDYAEVGAQHFCLLCHLGSFLTDLNAHT